MQNIYKTLLIFIILFSACKSDKRYHDNNTDKKALADKKTENTVSGIKKFQKELNEEYANPEESPLTQEDRESFNGLDFFPIDTTYHVVARFERTPDQEPFLMPTTTSRTSEEVLYGIVHFTLHQKEFKLNVYQSTQLRETQEYKDYLFLPFSDKTNGEETYGGGRYMDLRIPEGNTIVLDFNKAYNPYCAYNKKYSCPIVPKENTLNYAVRAGVKKFKKP
ncbi:DUF1684 domain-containing protein [Galbibacter sp. PAP.153]|uniref:DUF1684 domain-containing protein n=1 Tax=Galbibacter sp. PAP.153 TaxID=3104623 RepID=UPI00300B8E3F